MKKTLRVNTMFFFSQSSILCETLSPFPLGKTFFPLFQMFDSNFDGLNFFNN